MMFRRMKSALKALLRGQEGQAATEYALGATTVAIGWSGYVVSFLHDNIVPSESARVHQY